MTELRYAVKKTYEKVDGMAAYVWRHNNVLQFRNLVSDQYGQKYWTEWKDVLVVDEDAK